jgi:hypothetical protein
MQEKAHLTCEGLEQIIQIKASMNTGRDTNEKSAENYLIIKK